MSIYLLIFGAPGVGKGTQARPLARLLDVPHVVTSEVLRASADEASGDLGARLAQLLQRGDVLPDAIVVSALLRRLTADDCSRGAIIDGFPYTVGQAMELDSHLQRLGKRISLALYLHAPKPVSIRRLQKRWELGVSEEDPSPSTPEQCLERLDTRSLSARCPLRRHDDSPDLAVQRISTYLNRIAPALSYYGSRGILREVAADKCEAFVFGDLLKHLASLPSTRISAVGMIKWRDQSQGL
jgi:adenylate kinase